MTHTAETTYRKWQSKKPQVSLEDLPHFYEVENELFLRTLDIAKTRELENTLMGQNSAKQKLIENRSRCFATLKDETINFQSIIERLTNLNKAIYE